MTESDFRTWLDTVGRDLLKAQDELKRYRRTSKWSG
jgi:hypothetical protein